MYLLTADEITKTFISPSIRGSVGVQVLVKIHYPRQEKTENKRVSMMTAGFQNSIRWTGAAAVAERRSHSVDEVAFADVDSVRGSSDTESQ